MTKKKQVSAEERQKALDSISSEDLAKIEAHQAKTDGAYKVDQEWLLIAEFAKAFGGWRAYLAVKNDEISIAEMLTLIEANRRLLQVETFSNAHSSFIGSVSAQSKKPANTFKSLTKDIIKKTKADK